MIYATDLDRTIIFSKKFIDGYFKESICIEHSGEKEISYMTLESIQLLNSLKKINTLKIIPVTTRSIEQFKRVSTVQDCEYAITSNGGNILFKGNIFEPWKQVVDKIIKNYQEDFIELNKTLSNYKSFFEKDFKMIDNVFLYAKMIDNQEDIKFFYSEMEKKLDKNKWIFTLQGLKFYILPKDITKENALKFLADYLKDYNIISSGDGKLDYGFLKIAKTSIIPKNSEVLKYISNDNIEYIEVSEGLNAPIEIFNIVKNIALSY